MPYILVGTGAFLGANLRYLFGGWAASAFGPTFPYGTLLINVTGSFVIGIFLTLIGERFVAPAWLRLFFAIGFLGGYTTFSTFTFETMALIETRSYLAAALNLMGSVTLGMIAVVGGALLGRVL
jgi:CrcB protein